ncbi:MAG TPA: polyphenol oxidase family protein [Candidatus Syntrophosphaera sp.]|jgi:YfiH family protein|nr:polyphenol oxidase family protein [Candidatus Cloacimonadota bacterium]HOR03524.1 polyphenol oxidase family protein [Candidatus Syntrophosphaera sp.]HOU72140.1 polyphenol oxidase family protein [Candidatus Syntrophosphaera sp.]HPK83497.1 polyphenol oxidase family protein [Candidatus Syntrophosphaera sp.]HQG94923.1 polyphenol oxidase family protein [Candidatus Syntrophosphaera sp.]
MKTWLHLGEKTPDYRSVMSAQGDIRIGSKIIPKGRTVIAEQIAGDGIHICSEADGGAGWGDHSQIAGVDALITSVPGQYLLVRTADCYPVLLQDAQNRAVAAIHSGREGTRLNIVGKTVRVLQDEYGILPAEITAHIGAGICARHYEVDEATWESFNTSLKEMGCAADAAPAGSRHLDLRLAIFRQLIAAGIPFYNIEQQFVCTLESAVHHSYRRDRTSNRQMNLIGLEYE